MEIANSAPSTYSLGYSEIRKRTIVTAFSSLGIFQGQSRKLKAELKKAMWLRSFPSGHEFLASPGGMFRSDPLLSASFSFEKVEPDFEFWKGKLDRALDVRKKNWD